MGSTLEKIKYGIIGFGGIAENRLAKEGFACDRARFSPLANAELVCATSAGSSRKAAAEAMGLKWYVSADEVLADKKIDAVYIASNNLSHAPQALAALNAGKHVILEKPIATTAADAEALVNLAAARKLSLSVDHMMLHNAWNVRARELAGAEALGAINDACFHMEFAYGYEPAEAATWRCANPAEMGGPIGDVASHCLYMAEFVLNRTIEKIACVYLPKIMPTKVEDGAYIKYEMAGGLRGSVKVAFGEPRGGLGGTLTNLGYEIYGDKAVLRGYGTLFQFSGHEGEPIKIRLELDRFTSHEAVEPAAIKNIYRQVIERHAQSIVDGKPLNARDALHNIRMCLAAHESARAGGKFIEVH